VQDSEVRGLIETSIKEHQWRFRGTLALGVVVITLVAVLCWIVIARHAPNVEVRGVSALEGILSQNELSLRRIVAILATEQTPASGPKKTELDAVLAQYVRALDGQATASKALVEELKRQATGGGESLVPYANIITGGLFLGLLGFLGLTRLGQIDQEIKSLRENLLREVSDRVRLSEEASTAKLTAAIQERVESAQKRIEVAAQSAAQSVAQMEAESDRRFDEAKAEQESIGAEFERISAEVADLPKRYPFLMSAEKRDLIARIEQVESVEQVEALASDLNRRGEQEAALKALEQILIRRLPGAPDAIHNAHSEAMRMNASSMGLRIAQFGQETFPGNSDLAADTVLALISAGRPTDAVSIGEEWLRTYSRSQRTWRLAVFLAKSYRAQGLSPSQRARATELLESEATVLPREPKVWSELAQIYREYDSAAAYSTIDRGLDACPTSQELKFVKAQYLLEDGRPNEARPVLEDAIASDFQDQFQSNVNGAAVLCYYAQCLEALGERDAARRVFEFVKAQPGCHPVMMRFVEDRMNMLNLLDGRSAEPQSSSGLPPQLVELLRGRLGHPDGESTEE
jgi:predicted Zn-dependent protease